MDMMLPEGSGTTAYTRPKTRVYRVWNYTTVIRDTEAIRICRNWNISYRTSRIFPTWSPESKYRCAATT